MLTAGKSRNSSRQRGADQSQRALAGRTGFQHACDVDEGKGRPFYAAYRHAPCVEQNLENLNAAQLKNLVRKGYLARIDMHLLSLQNFGRLLDRNGRTA